MQIEITLGPNVRSLLQRELPPNLDPTWQAPNFPPPAWQARGDHPPPRSQPTAAETITANGDHGATAPTGSRRRVRVADYWKRDRLGAIGWG